jgi:hypothetical protein
LLPLPPQLRVPAAIDFGHQPAGVRSAGRPVRIENVSSSVAAITELTASGDFSVSDTCTTIAAATACSPLVSFQPSAVGTRTGSLTIRTLRDSAAYVVALSGFGDENPVPTLEVSATRIGFGNAYIGSATPARVTLVATGDLPVKVASIAVSGGFMLTHGCSVIAAHSACDIEVVFMPSSPGGMGGAIVIQSDALGSPHRVDLTGVGCYVPSPSRARFGSLLCGS